MAMSHMEWSFIRGGLKLGGVETWSNVERFPMTRKHRRILAGVLVTVGVILMLAATESTGGALLILAGVLLEVVGIAVDHRPRG